jgi:hypothetical protein
VVAPGFVETEMTAVLLRPVWEVRCQ